MDNNSEFFKGVQPMILKEIAKPTATKEENEIIIISPQGEEEIARTFLNKPELQLGKGLSSKVLETVDGRAAKIFFPQKDIPSAKLKSILSREAILESQIRHPHVAEFFGVGKIVVSKIEIPCLIKEKIPHNLEQVTEDHQLSMSDGAEMVKQVSSALDYIYNQTGEIITDLTPENIGRRDDGTWVVIELGETAHAGRTDESGHDSVYSAPECKPDADDEETEEEYLKRNNAASPASMVYSLSTVLWKSLTGEEVKDIAISEPINNIEGKIPYHIYQVLMKAVSQNPSDRYPTPTEFSKALAAAIKYSEEFEKYGDFSI